MKKQALLLLIIFMLFLPLASAVNYPQLRGFVTDNANMIDPVYEEKITQLAQKMETETSVEIAVVTIESLEGESKEMYAVNLFKQAGIGKKDKDNGLLILVAKKEREYRFEVGYGLEGTVTDSMKVNIGDRIIVPNFRNGEYGKGIYESMLVIEGLVKGNAEVISAYKMPAGNQQVSNQRGAGMVLSILFGTVIFFFIWIFFMYGIIKLGDYGKGNYGRGYYGREHYNESGSGFGGGFEGSGSDGGDFGGFGGGESGGGGFGGKW